ncbi:cache domain-containing protein [Thiomicrorhabdus sp. Kp2]|uniref:cache domain-containing protein n=1 Tax=Thiomicrorhabdus sp. Kp2 TaxID=1123518 RepID=UPI0005952C06|nr:cache domain-containing protein [Thiomicrorhabdus sp. Kp2]
MTQKNSSLDNKSYINYLPAVKAYIGELEHQDLWWSTVGMVGKINNENIDSQLLVSIVETQKEFQNLRDIMINELIGRYLNQANSEIMLKAQTTIDILIRNLFERTADVGFLATDDDLIEFMAKENITSEDDDFIDQRIQEYVAKYTVYDDIVLVKPNGDIKAKLNKSNPVTHSSDPLIKEALNTKEDYVEVFRNSDLFVNQSSLIYAKKITQTNENGSEQNLGVLCLSFNFDEEMKDIFRALENQTGYTLMLLDKEQKVIASNNSKKSLGTQFTASFSEDSKPVRNGNTLRFATKTNGYQGFYGLPWLGYAEIEMNDAFKDKQNKKDLGIEIPKESPLYLQDLEQTNLKVSTLLLTVILNGKIMSLKREVKSFLPILDRFQVISLEIQDIFSRFIRHIHQVLIDTIQSKASFSAALAIDVMDRNLYERANDCRWWALNSSFRQILTKNHQIGSITPEESKRLTKILAYINSLYTVYTNIILYDNSGKILAVSNESENHIVGTTLPRPTETARCLKLQDTQSYTVSEFHKSELYDNEYTYIYHAPVKAWEDLNTNVGGIALIFDSKPEFFAMLKETEPKYLNDAINKTTFSAYIDRDGKVISSTHPDIKAESILNMPKEVLEAENGENDTIAWQWNNTTYLVGYKVSTGYREYKNGDGYNNDVIGLMLTGI